MPVRRPSPGESHIIGSATHPAGVKTRGSALDRGSGERSRHPVLGEAAALTLAWRSVIGAGFALPRDAGRRPAASSPGGGPLSRAILLLTGTRREGSHPDGWGLRRRGPAGRCADRRSAFPCGRRHLNGWGSRAGLHFHSQCAAVPCRRAMPRSGTAPSAQAGIRGFARRRRAKPGQATDPLLRFPPPLPLPRAAAADPA